MTFEATAAVLYEPGGSFQLKSVTLDDLRADELLIRVQASGICHTDIAAQGMMTMPAVLGHEGMGIVEQIGSDVDGFKAGDRVIISYGSCNACPGCDEGKPYICDRSVQTNFGGTRIDGSHTTKLDGADITASFFQQSSFASHSITSVHNVVRVENGLESQLLAPLGCGIMTGAGSILNTLKVGAKDSLAVFGAGTVGLSAIMAARIAGAAPIIAVDINRQRLDLALELGASHALDASEGDIPGQINEICPRGVLFSFETSGVEQALNDAIECLGMGGVCGMVTVPNYGEKYPFTPFGVFVKAAALQGIFFGSAVPNTFLPQIIEFYQAGRFPYDQLIRTYDFADINQALADTQSGEVIKPVLLMN